MAVKSKQDQELRDSIHRMAKKHERKSPLNIRRTPSDPEFTRYLTNLHGEMDQVHSRITYLKKKLSNQLCNTYERDDCAVYSSVKGKARQMSRYELSFDSNGGTDRRQKRKSTEAIDVVTGAVMLPPMPLLGTSLAAKKKMKFMVLLANPAHPT